MSSHDPFSAFRTAYLRAVARSWHDEKFREELINAGRNGVKVLEEHFDLDFRWNIDFEFNYGDQSPIWFPDGMSNGWIGQPDKFTINIPAKPREFHDGGTCAIASYYQHFPTMLGSFEEKPATNERFRSSRALPDDFVNFGGQTLQIVMSAWTYDEFREQIIDKGDVRGIIEGRFDFMFPWNFELHFTTDPTAKWDAKQDEWTCLSRNLVTLHLPKAPMEAPDHNKLAEIRGAALVAYNDTGPQYPFTCG